MRLICTILSRSGTDCAPSHLETDCRVTFSYCASSSCDQPAFFRSVMILSARIIDCFLPVFVWMPSSYKKQRLHAINRTVKSVNRRLHFSFFSIFYYIFVPFSLSSRPFFHFPCSFVPFQDFFIFRLQTVHHTSAKIRYPLSIRKLLHGNIRGGPTATFPIDCVFPFLLSLFLLSL